MGKSLIEVLEQQELIQKLIDNGYGELVDALLSHEGSTFTKGERLNKSGTCRVLGWKTKKLEDTLAACRKVLENDF